MTAGETLLFLVDGGLDRKPLCFAAGLPLVHGLGGVLTTVVDRVFEHFGGLGDRVCSQIEMDSFIIEIPHFQRVKFQLALDSWKLFAMTRLELTVMLPNRRAIALYHKMGCIVEGAHHQSIRYQDSTYVDEYLIWPTS
ncbi:MAG: hypothetical protein C7B46_08510 [Sulfobacillus benefaciens]|uniref:Uncharacterized protein n=1 Tax=Sulfobacillus benefaciens TaxID=453960 RepID=A0A2T2XGS6_9FIRM|nr:MAG: hypothetical protein C7B46_08510 [Sulfobacillus benefaciens]